jgi:hypothetical protein
MSEIRIDDVRRNFSAISPEALAKFDRWLARRDKAVAAGALRAASVMDFEWEVFIASDGIPTIRKHGKTPAQVLRDRAVEIENGPQGEK